jgi:hypothetical protein
VAQVVWCLLRKHEVLSSNPTLIKKKIIEYPYNPAVPLLGIYPKEKRNISQHTVDIPAHPFLLQHYSQEPSYENRLSAYQQKNG